MDFLNNKFTKRTTIEEVTKIGNKIKGKIIKPADIAIHADMFLFFI